MAKNNVVKIKKSEFFPWAYTVLISLLLLVIYSMLEASTVVLDRVTFTDEDIPQSFEGYKIIFVSDIHTGLFLNSHALQDLIKTIDSENPDVVLLGGDYIDYNPSDYIGITEGLKGLYAKDGVYGVMGNHDICYGLKETKEFFSTLNIKNIENTSVKLTKNGQTILLSGTEEAIFGKPDIAKAMQNINENDLNLFVTHNPLLFAIDKENNYNSKIDLALMGHTHGGQISFFGLVSLWTDRFAAYYRPSLRERNGLKYILSNGYGTSFLPARFYVPPQVHVITLNRPA